MIIQCKYNSKQYRYGFFESQAPALIRQDSWDLTPQIVYAVKHRGRVTKLLRGGCYLALLPVNMRAQTPFLFQRTQSNTEVCSSMPLKHLKYVLTWELSYHDICSQSNEQFNIAVQFIITSTSTQNKIRFPKNTWYSKIGIHISKIRLAISKIHSYLLETAGSPFCVESTPVSQARDTGPNPT